MRAAGRPVRHRGDAPLRGRPRHSDLPLRRSGRSRRRARSRTLESRRDGASGPRTANGHGSTWRSGPGAIGWSELLPAAFSGRNEWSSSERSVTVRPERREPPARPARSITPQRDEQSGRPPDAHRWWFPDGSKRIKRGARILAVLCSSTVAWAALADDHRERRLADDRAGLSPFRRRSTRPRLATPSSSRAGSTRA